MSGLEFEDGDVYTAARMNVKTRIVGTGAQIAAVSSPQVGQEAHCTQTGSGFEAGFDYYYDGADWRVAGSSLPEFGDGSDGDVTISTDTTLTADKNYNTLKVDSGVNLNTDGYVVRVKETLMVEGTIHDNGGGGAGGARALGHGTGYPGGSGSSRTATLKGSAITLSLGEGGGGGGGSTCKSNGGDGGNGGGIVKIYAKHVWIKSSGKISADGVNGGNASSPSYAGGGGGGGGGGTVFLFYATLTNDGSITVSGGAGGTGGSGSGYTHVESGGAGGSGAGDFGGSGGAGGGGAVGGNGKKHCGSAGGGGVNYATGYNGGTGADGRVVLMEAQ